MRKLIYLTTIAVLLCCVCAAADTALLPDQFGAWHAADASKITARVNMSPSDALADVRNEAGFLRIEERAYQNGEKELKVRITVFKDPTGAYQYFTQTTTTDHRKLTQGDESAFATGNGNILLGNLVIQVGSNADLKAEELDGLDAALRTRADHTPYPPLK